MINVLKRFASLSPMARNPFLQGLRFMKSKPYYERVEGMKYGPVDPKHKRMQKFFQEHQESPIWFKGVGYDKQLYYMTFVLTLIGLVFATRNVWQWMMKDWPED